MPAIYVFGLEKVFLGLDIFEVVYVVVTALLFAPYVLYALYLALRFVWDVFGVFNLHDDDDWALEKPPPEPKHQSRSILWIDSLKKTLERIGTILRREIHPMLFVFFLFWPFVLAGVIVYFFVVGLRRLFR